jgi:hypothetical protein
MVPAGTLDVVSGRGKALKLAGEVPIEQLIWAPVQHCNPIAGLLSQKTRGKAGTAVSCCEPLLFGALQNSEKIVRQV